MKRITAKTVAQRAGTSLAAVSRAFDAQSPLAAEKRAAILGIARELGYEPPSARAVRRLTKGTISLVATELSNPFYPVVLDELSQRLHAQDRKLVLHAVPPSGSVDLVMQQVLDFRSDAAIVTSATMSSQLARECRRRHLPVVLFNRVQIDTRMAAVTCDNYEGGRLAAQRLLARGCRRIGQIMGLRDTSTHLERSHGFRDALLEAGADLFCSEAGDYSYEGTRAVARGLFEASVRPDGLFCENDVMALAVLDVARIAGLRVPEDLAVIGFDNIPQASWNAYQLTTVAQPYREMISETLAMVDRMLLNPETGGDIRVLPVRLVTRKTA